MNRVDVFRRQKLWLTYIVMPRTAHRKATLSWNSDSVSFDVKFKAKALTEGRKQRVARGTPAQRRWEGMEGRRLEILPKPNRCRAVSSGKYLDQV